MVAFVRDTEECARVTDGEMPVANHGADGDR